MKNTTDLRQELYQAKELLTVGDIYCHYKHPEKLYQVLSVAFLESTEEVCIVYQSLYTPYLVWIRSLNNFLEKVVVDDKEMHRFTKIETL